MSVVTVVLYFMVAFAFQVIFALHRTCDAFPVPETVEGTSSVDCSEVSDSTTSSESSSCERETRERRRKRTSKKEKSQKSADGKSHGRHLSNDDIDDWRRSTSEKPCKAKKEHQRATSSTYPRPQPPTTTYTPPRRAARERTPPSRTPEPTLQSDPQTEAAPRPKVRYMNSGKAHTWFHTVHRNVVEGGRGDLLLHHGGLPHEFAFILSLGWIDLKECLAWADARHTIGRGLLDLLEQKRKGDEWKQTEFDVPMGSEELKDYTKSWMDMTRTPYDLLPYNWHRDREDRRCYGPFGPNFTSIASPAKLEEVAAQLMSDDIELDVNCFSGRLKPILELLVKKKESEEEAPHTSGSAVDEGTNQSAGPSEKVEVSSAEPSGDSSEAVGLVQGAAEPDTVDGEHVETSDACQDSVQQSESNSERVEEPEVTASPETSNDEPSVDISNDNDQVPIDEQLVASIAHLEEGRLRMVRQLEEMLERESENVSNEAPRSPMAPVETSQQTDGHLSSLVQQDVAISETLGTEVQNGETPRQASGEQEWAPSTTWDESTTKQVSGSPTGSSTGPSESGMRDRIAEEEKAKAVVTVNKIFQEGGNQALSESSKVPSIPPETQDKIEQVQASAPSLSSSPGLSDVGMFDGMTEEDIAEAEASAAELMREYEEFQRNEGIQVQDASGTLSARPEPQAPAPAQSSTLGPSEAEMSDEMTEGEVAEAQAGFVELMQAYEEYQRNGGIQAQCALGSMASETLPAQVETQDQAQAAALGRSPSPSLSDAGMFDGMTEEDIAEAEASAAELMREYEEFQRNGGVRVQVVPESEASGAPSTRPESQDGMEQTGISVPSPLSPSDASEQGMFNEQDVGDATAAPAEAVRVYEESQLKGGIQRRAEPEGEAPSVKPGTGENGEHAAESDDDYGEEDEIAKELEALLYGSESEGDDSDMEDCTVATSAAGHEPKANARRAEESMSDTSVFATAHERCVDEDVNMLPLGFDMEPESEERVVQRDTPAAEPNVPSDVPTSQPGAAVIEEAPITPEKEMSESSPAPITAPKTAVTMTSQSRIIRSLPRSARAAGTPNAIMAPVPPAPAQSVPGIVISPPPPVSTSLAATQEPRVNDGTSNLQSGPVSASNQKPAPSPLSQVPVRPPTSSTTQGATPFKTPATPPKFSGSSTSSQPRTSIDTPRAESSSSASFASQTRSQIIPPTPFSVIPSISPLRPQPPRANPMPPPTFTPARPAGFGAFTAPTPFIPTRPRAGSALPPHGNASSSPSSSALKPSPNGFYGAIEAMRLKYSASPAAAPSASRPGLSDAGPSTPGIPGQRGHSDLPGSTKASERGAARLDVKPPCSKLDVGKGSVPSAGPSKSTDSSSTPPSSSDLEGKGVVETGSASGTVIPVRKRIADEEEEVLDWGDSDFDSDSTSSTIENEPPTVSNIYEEP